MQTVITPGKWAIVALGLLIALALFMPSGRAEAAPQSISLKSGVGSVGAADPLTEVSTNGGGSWNQATIIPGNVAWAPALSGTNWVFCASSAGDSCGLGTATVGKTTKYRAAFTLPAGFSAASLSVSMHADNAATIYVNGNQIGQQPCVGQPEAGCNSPPNFTGGADTFSTSNAAHFQVGTNYLQIDVWDVGGISGVDYSSTVTYTPNSPPSLNVGGTVTYTEDSPAVTIAPALTLVDPDNDPIDGARVSIGAGFNAAQDSLAVSGSLPAGLTSSYNSTTGVLTINGSGSPAAYQQALRQVVFNNNSQNPSNTPRTVTFNIGSQLAFAGNGHFYEFVNQFGIRWDTAQAAAATKSLHGLQGYMATITSQAENDFIFQKLQGNGWIGASDAATEGQWRWVTGPEAGTVFCNGNNPCTPAGGQYHNWNAGEPNNAGNEDYAHMIGNPAIGTSGPGVWNDLPVQVTSGAFAPLGYVVEYGGMPGDPILNLSGSVTVNVQPVNDPPTANAGGPYTVNEGSSVTLTGSGADHPAEGTAVTFAWDLDNDGTFETPGQNATFNGLDGPATHTVGLRVCDSGTPLPSACTTATTTVTVNNVAPTVDTTPSASGTFTVPGTSDGITGFNTGITLSGNTVSITASGSWDCNNPGCQAGPNGIGGPTDGTFLLAGTAAFNLIAKVGSGPWQVVGAGPTPISGTGALTLAMNDTFWGDNHGSMLVEVVPAAVANEGPGGITQIGTYSDPGDDNVAISASVGSVTKTGTNAGGWTWTNTTPDGPDDYDVIITADDGDGGTATAKFHVFVNNVAPNVTVNVNTGNTVYYVDWLTASPSGGTASGVITLPNGDTVTVDFDALNPDGSHASFFGAQTSGGTYYWTSPSPFTTYTSPEVPNPPPTSDILQLEGGVPNITYKVTLSEPIVDPIMAIHSLGGGPVFTTYDFDSPFTILSQGGSFHGGDATRLAQLPGDVLQGREGNGTIRFNGTFSTFSWVAPTFERWHGFTFAIRTTAALGNTDVFEGETATNSGTWSDPGLNGDGVVVSASVGSVVTNANGTWDWSYVTTDGPAQSQTVVVTATDKDGASTSESFPLTVKNVAPTAILNAPTSVNEGSPFTLSLTGQSDPSSVDTTAGFTYAFNCGGGFGPYGPSASATCNTAVDGPATLNVGGRIRDKDGGENAYAASVTVLNVDPAVGADAASVTVDEGTTAANTGTFSDVPVDTVTISASVGSITQTGSSTGTWSWSNAAPDGPDIYTVTITAADEDGGSNTASFTVTVNNVDPAVDADAASVTVDEGDTAGNTGTFSDVPADTVTISASVGSVTQTGSNTGTWSWSNAAPDGPDTYTVTITAADEDGGSSTASFTVTVNNVDPTVGADASSVTVNEGTTAANTGTFSDPGNDDVTITASVGTVTKSGLNSGTWSWSNPAPDGPDSYTVTITADDGDGGVDSVTFGVTVNNVAPTITAIVNSGPIDEGAIVGVTVTATDPAGALDPLSYEFDCNNDGSYEIGPQSGNAASCTFGDDGSSYTVGVRVTDGDGGEAVSSTIVTVNNVAPSVTLDISGATTFAGGLAFTGRKGVAQSHDASGSDPGSDDLTFIWSFGQTDTVFNNGTGPDPDNSPGGAFPFAASNTGTVTFTAPGVYNLGVDLADDDGGVDSASLPKVVVDDCDCTKSQGFWKKQFKSSVTGKGKQQIDDASLESYLAIVRFGSGIFNEQIALSGIADANLILNPEKNRDNGNSGGGSNGSKDQPSNTNSRSRGKDKDDDGSDDSGSNNDSGSATGSAGKIGKSREKALTQTLAAWLNYAKGSVDYNELVDTDGDGIADTSFSAIIAQVESILANPAATKADLDHAKDLAESINLHDKDNPDCDTGTGSKGDDTGSKTATAKGTSDGSKGGKGKKK